MKRRKFPLLAFCWMLWAIMFIGTVVEKWAGVIGDPNSTSRF